MHVAQSIARMIPAMLMPIMSVLRIFRDFLSADLFFFIFLTNEPVEKVTFLKSASSAGSKIENYFLSSKGFTILGAMFVFS